MPWFPVVESEVAEVEALLGIALPPRYKSLMSDTRVQQLLAHPTLGALSPNASMHAFVAQTDVARRTLPGFPADGVVATDTPGRYVRYWLPDRSRSGVLGEMLYSWDKERRRGTKDCTGQAIIDGMIAIVQQSDAALVEALGHAPRAVRAERPLLEARSVRHTLVARATDGTRIEEDGASASWIAIAEFEVQGRYLTPCDVGELPEQSRWSLSVVPGTYVVEAQVAQPTAGAAAPIAAIRLRRIGCGPHEIHAAGWVDIDRATLAIYDRQAFFARVPVARRDAFLMELDQVRELPAVVVAGGRVLLLLVPTGAGDGRYRVSELRSDSEVVGMEVRFA